MRPPRDFKPALEPPAEPTLDELLELADRERKKRAERQREQEWKWVREGARRETSGQLVGRNGGTELPGYLRDPECMGPRAIAHLRTLAKTGRVVQAGVDTWSPAWYGPPGSSLEKAMSRLAVAGGSRVKLVPGTSWIIAWAGSLTPVSSLPRATLVVRGSDHPMHSQECLNGWRSGSKSSESLSPAPPEPECDVLMPASIWLQIRLQRASRSSPASPRYPCRGES